MENKIEKLILEKSWNKQFNKAYYFALAICSILTFVNNLHSVVLVTPWISIIVMFAHIIGTIVLVSVVFLMIGIILKLLKKLVHYRFRRLILVIVIGTFVFIILDIVTNAVAGITAKPVIYLYPKEKEDVSVELNFQGKIIADYPRYNETIKGWNVTAYPDGHLINHSDNQEYSYIFWEGRQTYAIRWDFSKGFVVKGEDTREFLRQILTEIGLTTKEYNEFIVYWYPLMKDNPYNLIHFANEQYTETAPLTITPKPDSMLRVFMVFRPLTEKIGIEPQIIQSFERKGFTVVEWGGTEVN